MTTTEITRLSLKELSEKFQGGALTSLQITNAFLENIEQKNQEINAFITITADLAREMAKAADERQKAGKLLSELDGMPIAIKDNISTTGVKTTAASKMLENYIPPFDAVVWERLKNAGMILLGKTNLDEFTMGGSTETSAYGYVRNPHDHSRVAGGSSGGSAAAIAAGMAPVALGTDTGGSIRQPASYCGISGLKVSYGRVPRAGCMAFASSLDSIGCFGKTAEDCAMLLKVMAGKDARDGTTPDKTIPNYTKFLKNPLNGKKIGIPKEYYEDAAGLNPEVAEKVEKTKERLVSLGAELVDISLPHTKYAIPIYYIVAPSEASANLARFDGIRFGERRGEKNLEEIYTQTRGYGFGDEVKRRILIGTYALSAGYYDAFYKKAQKVRTLVKQDFEKAFTQVDAILTPTDADVAFKAGQGYDDPLKMYLQDLFVAPASVSGLCGINVPIGVNSENLPIGAQIIGPAFSEEVILNMAHQLEINA
jgi:aspartyl-tRNA(Asn)/glutamyl-tRNA(Gln) amidotransferase subunit A